MLTIRDLAGNEEGLIDFKELTLNRKVNGEKTISLTILPTVHNAHSFPMIEEESIITFNEQEYVIKKLSERSIGNKTIKRVDAIHKFYVDMINKQQPLIHNGSMTFDAFLQFVFGGTGYTYSIIDTFYAQSFENLGNENRLALQQKGLERFKAEFELIGTQARFKTKIGNDTDFQFRYGHSVKAIEKTVDTTNLATVISGTGEEGIMAYYRSPNADIFGEIDAPPVIDERFTTEAALLAEMKARLEDTPEFSITIDFADLRAAGYPWTVPNEGDRVFVIYEPMADLLIETRIMEIVEVFDTNLKPIKTNVTLANYKKTFSGTMFNNVQKQLRNIVSDDGVVRYNVLDEAVKIATEALKSAQTELEFENGIIARDKTNPNFLVLLNSNGIGISRDGGNTFKEAITSEGFVLSAGAIGQLAANNIQIGATTTYASGYDPSTKETPTGAQDKADGVGQSVRDDLRLAAPLPTSLTLNQNGIRASTSDPTKYAQLDYRGLYIAGGAIQIAGGLPDSQISGASGWNNQGTYIDANGIYTGSLTANQVNTGTLNADLVSIANNKVQLNSNGIYVYKNSVLGASLVEGNLTFNDQVNAAKIGMFAATLWSDGTTKGISMNMEPNRYISFGHYTGAETGYTPMVVFNPGTAMAGVPRGLVSNLPYRANDDIWAGNKAVRFGENNTHNHSSMWHDTNDNLAIGSYTGVKLGYLTTGGVMNDRLTVDSNSVDAWQDLDMHGWKILNVAEVQTTSFAELKQDIIVWDERALERINQATIHQYRLKSDVQKGIDKLKHGLVIGEGYNTPQELVNDGGIDLYTMSSWSWKATQELSKQNEELTLKMAQLEERLAKLEGSGTV